MCQSLVWVRYNTYATSGGYECYYMSMWSRRGETAVSAKNGNISLELPLKCDYTLKSNIEMALGSFIYCQS